MLTLLFLTPCMLLTFKLEAKLPQLKMPRTQVTPIRDSQSNRLNELYIKLPDNYDEYPKKRYPVIYFTDAAWHIEIISASTEYLLNDAILVGISWQKDISPNLIAEHGAHVSRFRDFSMTKSSDQKIQTKYQLGQANAHLSFIQQDVFKYIEKHYRTQSDNRSYFGYSAGAAFGAFIIMNHPHTFKNYIIGSPGLEGDIAYLNSLKSELKSKLQNKKVNKFISHGHLERKLAENTVQLLDILDVDNNESLSLTHEVINGNHKTAYPLTGVKSITRLADVQNNKG